VSERVQRSGGPDEATAYHEAGHAVVALALDRPVVKVSILADRDRLGICFFGKAVFRPSEDWLEREMLIALAGLAAEARHTGAYDREAAAARTNPRRHRTRLSPRAGIGSASSPS
jgi:ATP-dependent Zn protease